MKKFKLLTAWAMVTALLALQGVSKTNMPSPNTGDGGVQELQRKLVSQHNALFGKRNFWRFAISDTDATTFKHYLAEVKNFIGQDDKQRAQDFATVTKIWQDIIANSNRLFEYLKLYRMPSELCLTQFKGSQEAQKKCTQQSGDKIKWEQLDRFRLSRGASKLSSFFPAFDQDVIMIQRILERTPRHAQKCYGQACKDRFKILEMHAQFLLATLEAIHTSLWRLEEFAAKGSGDPKDVE